ncbi:hypothetical protein DPMN_143226 [Dreissena polymorpha]|uniref:Uncharacterized protein n=1 Tax=Dreissena polymorpha TaxID=45954 RepID=A0A9D4JP58_DREPO|nr:hypothetical protein DPMN_143226 [Dreissena polymorpha]
MPASHYRGDCLPHSAAQSSCTITHPSSAVVGIPIPLMSEEDNIGSELSELAPISAKLMISRSMHGSGSHGCPCESGPTKIGQTGNAH